MRRLRKGGNLNNCTFSGWVWFANDPRETRDRPAIDPRETPEGMREREILTIVPFWGCREGRGDERLRVGHGPPGRLFLYNHPRAHAHIYIRKSGGPAVHRPTRPLAGMRLRLRKTWQTASFRKQIGFLFVYSDFFSYLCAVICISAHERKDTYYFWATLAAPAARRAVGAGGGVPPAVLLF